VISMHSLQRRFKNSERGLGTSVFSHQLLGIAEISADSQTLGQSDLRFSSLSRTIPIAGRLFSSEPRSNDWSLITKVECRFWLVRRLTQPSFRWACSLTRCPTAFCRALRIESDPELVKADLTNLRSFEAIARRLGVHCLSVR
jgi:hypothetical protein